MKRDELDALLDEKLAKLFGQLTRHTDGRIGELKTDVSRRFDHLDTTLDGVARRLETDEQERAAMNYQLDRHEGWIGQLAKSTKIKLLPDPNSS